MVLNYYLYARTELFTRRDLWSPGRNIYRFKVFVKIYAIFALNRYLPPLQLKNVNELAHPQSLNTGLHHRYVIKKFNFHIAY